MTAIFRAMLADGNEVVGPMQGAGGLLGAGLGDVPEARRARACADSLRRLVDHSSQVTMYPACSAMGNGKAVEVPVQGTRFYLVRVGE